MTAIPPRARRGFKLADACVALAVLVVLFAAVVFWVDSARRSSGRIRCASNLRQIAMAAIMYAGGNTNRPGTPGSFPRTTYDPAAADRPVAYTRADATSPFGPGGPAANDVTAAAFLLVRTQDLGTDVFTCEYDDATPLRGDFRAVSNFPGRRHLSYSFVNPYPSPAAVAAGWKLDATLPPDYPFASDLNPGTGPGGSPATVPYNAPRLKMMPANSPNHWFEGQQVVYVDAHVEWQTKPFCGAPRKGSPFRDNIFTAGNDVDPTTGIGGVIVGSPVDGEDAVLLPAADDAGAARPVAVARRPGEERPRVNTSPTEVVGWSAVAVAALLVLIAAGLYRRPAPTRRAA